MSESQAPLCFGALSFHSTDSDRCQACPSFGPCGERVTVNMREISRVLDIDGLMERHRAAKVRIAERAKLAADPGRLKTQATALERNTAVGTASIRSTDDATRVDILSATKEVIASFAVVGSVEDLREALQAGTNPFPRSMTEQWFIGELLLRGAATVANINAAVARGGLSALKAKGASAAFIATKIATQATGGMAL